MKISRQNYRLRSEVYNYTNEQILLQIAHDDQMLGILFTYNRKLPRD